MVLIFNIYSTGKLIRAIFSVERCISDGHNANFFLLWNFHLTIEEKIVFMQAILAPDTALTSVFPNTARTGEYSCCGNSSALQRAPNVPEITKTHV